MQASMGLVQLDKLPSIIEKRTHNFNRLYDVFSKYGDKFVLPKATDGADPSWFAFPLTVKDNADFKRTEFTMYMEDNKVQTRNYFGGNILLQPAYSHLCEGDPVKDYPIATKATTNTFFLGTSPIITDEQIDYIDSVVTKFFADRGSLH
jgi:CDP-6-deoxy-D-xylo-4-hexulose-3-dehydrase